MMRSLGLLRIQVAAVLAVAIALLTSACGVPEYSIIKVSSIGGAGGTPGTSSSTGGAGGVGGFSPTGGQSAFSCTSNKECSTFAATKVCDNSISPGRCVECLPGVTDCGPGLYCGADKSCHVGCSSNVECDASFCDASVCPSLTCNTTLRLCQGCTQDGDCLPGTKCNTKTGTCNPSCSTSATCPTGWVCCAGTCANIRTDAANCASCGTSCAEPNANVQCLNGTCRIDACAEGYADCNGKYADGCETDLLSDATNCKTCGAACATSLACRNGTCTAPSCTDGYADCDKNTANSCETDTARDILNCGSCGNGCSMINGKPSCVTGLCSMSCESGWGDCNKNGNDGCETDLAITSDHCGTCKVACSNGHGSTACVDSKCIPRCDSGFGNCNSNPIDGCETSLTADANNCGDCNHICALNNATAACNGGKCAVGTCQANYGDCNAVASDGCEVPLLTSVADCGKCGNACSSNNGTPACVGGQCTIGCSPNYGNCDNDPSNGCETDLTKSVKNCGACGAVCTDTSQYSATCVGGSCGVSSCTKPAAECDNNAATLCETNLNGDPANCGSCGHVCALANASATCSNGVCIIDGCSPGYGDCNGEAADGCEVNTNQDLANCGKCGVPCAPEHASATCGNGICAISGCEKDYVDCNEVAADGCEAHVSDDPNNCGACKNICALDHATAGCAAGNCIVASCNPGYQDCNAVATNGCETETNGDVNNCGGCNVICSSVNGTPVCSTGACAISCTPGYADCSSASPGCETDVQTNLSNCGSCGNACAGSNPVCASGKCLLDIVAQTSNAVTGTGYGTSTPSLAHNLSLGSSNKRLVVLTVVGRGDSALSQMEDPKYGGTAMKQYATANLTGGNMSIGVYYLLDADLPASPGSNTVTFTGYGQNWGIVATVIEFDNVDQTTPFVAKAQNVQDCSTQPSVVATIPAAGDFSIEVVGAFVGSSTSATPKGGQTIVASAGTSANVFGVTGVGGPYAGASTSQTLGWTLGSCNYRSQLAAVIGRASN